MSAPTPVELLVYLQRRGWAQAAKARSVYADGGDPDLVVVLQQNAARAYAAARHQYDAIRRGCSVSEQGASRRDRYDAIEKDVTARIKKAVAALDAAEATPPPFTVGALRELMERMKAASPPPFPHGLAVGYVPGGVAVFDAAELQNTIAALRAENERLRDALKSLAVKPPGRIIGMDMSS